MKSANETTVSILHNRVPNRIRFRVPLIKYRPTFADILKQAVLTDIDSKGIYHAEPNITTASLLVKYHSSLHSEAQVVAIVERLARALDEGQIVIAAKHKNPRLGKMLPRAFFTRELIVSVFGNVIAGLILAAALTR